MKLSDILQSQMDKYLKAQDFEGAATVREVKRAFADHKLDLEIKSGQVEKVEAFLDVIAPKCWQSRSSQLPAMCVEFFLFLLKAES